MHHQCGLQIQMHRYKTRSLSLAFAIRPTAPVPLQNPIPAGRPESIGACACQRSQRQAQPELPVLPFGLKQPEYVDN